VDGAISIGRNAQNSLCLEGDGISRTHALIDVSARGLRVEDRSSNGTLAGEVLLRKRAVEIPYGTPIVVGHYTLVVNPAGVPFPAMGHRPGPPPSFAQASPHGPLGQTGGIPALSTTSGHAAMAQQGAHAHLAQTAHPGLNPGGAFPAAAYGAYPGFNIASPST